MDEQLIQIIGGGDDRIRKACLIQHLARLLGQIGEVAAVKADSVALRLDACFFHFPENADGVGHTGFQCVVSIHQERAGIRI